jgi:hypothetical protein
MDALGRRFIARDGAQALHLLAAMLARPAEVDVLRPYFAPARLPDRFVSLYWTVRARRGPEPLVLLCAAVAEGTGIPVLV